MPFLIAAVDSLLRPSACLSTQELGKLQRQNVDILCRQRGRGLVRTVEASRRMPSMISRPLALGLASALVVGFFSAPASLQQLQKGGEDETGPYEVGANWPQPWAKQGYIWGSQPAVFAETPNRVFLGVRGELKLPPTLGRGFNGIWGSLGE